MFWTRMPAAIAIDSTWIAEFYRRHQIGRLSLFGSAFRSDFGDGSPELIWRVVVADQPDLAGQLEKEEGGQGVRSLYW